jgi:hypothetical protein
MSGLILYAVKKRRHVMSSKQKGYLLTAVVALIAVAVAVRVPQIGKYVFGGA